MAAMKTNKALGDAPVVNMTGSPEIFVDGFQGLSMRNNVVKINFFTTRLNSKTRKEDRVGALILTTSLADLVNISDGLYALIKEMKDSGVIVEVPITDTQANN